MGLVILWWAEPVWLSSLRAKQKCKTYRNEFLPTLIQMIQLYDVKRTRHFVSTLLTGVLMFHLTWVTTVCASPEGVDTQRSKRELDSDFFPYNPLWAQLGDMHGSIGDPATFARTIVAGQDVDLVSKLLYIITYFIRCSEVCERVKQRPPVWSDTRRSVPAQSRREDHAIENGMAASTRDRATANNPGEAASGNVRSDYVRTYSSVNPNFPSDGGSDGEHRPVKVGSPLALDVWFAFPWV